MPLKILDDLAVPWTALAVDLSQKYILRLILRNNWATVSTLIQIILMYVNKLVLCCVKESFWLELALQRIFSLKLPWQKRPTSCQGGSRILWKSCPPSSSVFFSVTSVWKAEISRVQRLAKGTVHKRRCQFFLVFDTPVLGKVLGIWSFSKLEMEVFKFLFLKIYFSIFLKRKSVSRDCFQCADNKKSIINLEVIKK